MNWKYITIGVVIVAAVIIGAIVFTSDAPVVTPPGNQNVGSINSTNVDITGGVRTYKKAIALQTSTTTVCAIQSPAATSTLLSAGIGFKVSSTTASTVTMARGATAFATTTKLGSVSLAANAKGTVMATTTTSPGTDGDSVFPPSYWFVVGMAGGIGTFSPSGTCHASFEEWSY